MVKKKNEKTSIADNEDEIVSNKKARFQYEIVEKIEAGIALAGTEVKSLRAKQANISDAFARINKGEIYAINIHISPYTFGNINNHKPDRERKLLLHKKEIKKWESKNKEKGFTLVPLKMYFKNGKVKVLLGLCRGKKLYDKREDLKERDSKRELDRIRKQQCR